MNTIEYTTSIPKQELDLSCFFSEHTFFPAEQPSYTQNVRSRSELYIPTLYFPSVDPTEKSWARTLGAKTFVSWLELHTLVNHENGWNKEGRVELSLDYTMKILDMAKSTFYKTVIHPLWNYGLIDLVESEYEKNGTKALNIVVYPYPLNDFALAKKPLTQIRNYKTDYKSKSKSYGEKGAQMRAILKQIDLDKLALNDPSIYTDEALNESVEPVSQLSDNQSLTNIDNVKALDEAQEALYLQQPNPNTQGFVMPNSTVSIFEPKYSTTNIIYRTEDIRYLTVNKINNLNVEFLNKSIDSLTENLLISQNNIKILPDFVAYLQSHNFSLDFIAEVFDTLEIYCTTEQLLMNYIAMIKFDIERGMQISYPRIYVRNIYETGKKLN